MLLLCWELGVGIIAVLFTAAFGSSLVTDLLTLGFILYPSKPCLFVHIRITALPRERYEAQVHVPPDIALHRVLKLHRHR